MIPAHRVDRGQNLVRLALRTCRLRSASARQAGALAKAGQGPRHGGCRRIEIHQSIETQRAQVRNPQLDLLRDVPKRVAALVAVGGGIRQFAAADAVEHDQEDAREGSQACWVEK